MKFADVNEFTGEIVTSRYCNINNDKKGKALKISFTV